MKNVILTLALLLGGANLCFGQSSKPLLMRSPTVSESHIVFAYAGDL